MSVPEAAVYEDDGPVLRKHEIGRAGQPAVVEPVSITLAPQSVTHDLLRLRVAGADVGHTDVPLGGCHRIGHNLQEPEVVAADGGGNDSAGEVRSDAGDHFGVFDGDREVLLLDGFPVDAAELIDLVYKVLDGVLVQQ